MLYFLLNIQLLKCIPLSHVHTILYIICWCVWLCTIMLRPRKLMLYVQSQIHAVAWGLCLPVHQEWLMIDNRHTYRNIHVLLWAKLTRSYEHMRECSLDIYAKIMWLPYFCVVTFVTLSILSTCLSPNMSPSHKHIQCWSLHKQNIVLVRGAGCRIVAVKPGWHGGFPGNHWDAH